MLNLSLKSKNFIVKSNALIEARYRLSLQESQVILWLLTQIRHDDEDFKQHRLDISEFAKFARVKIGNRYSEVRKVTRRLMQRVMEIYNPEEKKLLQISWLSSAEYEYKKGVVLLKFDPGLKPYLLQLKSHFTKIGVVDLLELKSVYSIRILELLIQYESIGKRVMTIDDIRLWCDIEKNKYQLYAHLKNKIIEKAKNEISSKTQYLVDYKEIKESRKVVAIEWRISRKNSEKEKLQDEIKTLANELNYKFVLIKDLMDYGYSKSLSTKIVKENEDIVIKNALSVVSAQLSKNQVKNPGAMLRVAIKEKWNSEHYITHKQNRTENVRDLLDPNPENTATDNNNSYSNTQQFDILADLSKMLKKF